MTPLNEKTTDKQSGVRPAPPINPWDSSLDKLKEWDPQGAELLLRRGTNPWNSSVLPRKEVELIPVSLLCACTNLDETGTRRQIRAALDAGVQPRRAHSPRGDEGGGSNCRRRREVGDAGMRRDAEDGPVEHGVGPVLRPFPALNGRPLRLRSTRHLQEWHLYSKVHRAEQH